MPCYYISIASSLINIMFRLGQLKLIPCLFFLLLLIDRFSGSDSSTWFFLSFGKQSYVAHHDACAACSPLSCPYIKYIISFGHISITYPWELDFEEKEIATSLVRREDLEEGMKISIS